MGLLPHSCAIRLWLTCLNHTSSEVERLFTLTYRTDFVPLQMVLQKNLTQCFADSRKKAKIGTKFYKKESDGVKKPRGKVTPRYVIPSSHAHLHWIIIYLFYFIFLPTNRSRSKENLVFEKPATLSAEQKAFLESAPKYDAIREVARQTHTEIELYVSIFWLSFECCSVGVISTRLLGVDNQRF